METVKTAVIVLLLMAVLYGVYVVLNKPENSPSLTETDLNRQTATELSVDFGSAKTSTTPPLSGGASVDASVISAAVPPPPVNVDSPASPLPPASSIPTPPSFAAAEDSRRPSAEAPGSADSVPIPPSSITNLLSADYEQKSPDAATETPARELPTGVEAPTPPASLASSITASSATPIAAAESTAAAPPESPAPPASAWPAKPASYTEEPTTATRPATPEAAPAPPELPTLAARNPENKPKAEFAGNTAPNSQTDAAPAAPAPVGDPATDSGPAHRSSLDRVMQSVQSKINSGEWYQALFTLSLQYNAETPPADRQRLLDILDPLAAKVIYSKEHLIEAPYDVRRGDTLNSVAQRYNVPWQLLANVNGLTDPEALTPGMQLKVIPGPFRAEVDVNGRELTLFVGRLYAGRFPISVGSDPSPPAGEYRVNDKQPGRTYYSADGRTMPVEDPRNPYGQIWIDLGGDVCIHGSPSSDADARMGCISLSPADANDLYGILSKGSAIVIRR
jgi:lipoprotein-anchoring transpeptidase ErfK/SrfK